MVDKFIHERLSTIPELGNLERIKLPRDYVVKRKHDVLQALMHGQSFSKEGYIDAAGMESDEIRSWMLSLGVDAQVIEVIWLSTEVAVKISMGIFIKYYDDFWYPSSDDVIVSDMSSIWILDIDHEEIFTFWRRKHLILDC